MERNAIFSAVNTTSENQAQIKLASMLRLETTVQLPRDAVLLQIFVRGDEKSKRLTLHQVIVLY